MATARRAAAFLLEKMRVDGRWHRVYKDGKTQQPAFLDDCAYLLEAFVDLYEASFDPSYLAEAEALATQLFDGFWDDDQGGFFFTADYHETLICRKRDLMDNATPAASGVAVLGLLRLEKHTGQAEYRQRAEAALKLATPLIGRAPMAFGYTLVAVDFLHSPSVEIAVVADRAEALNDLLEVVHATFLPHKVLVGYGGEASAQPQLPLLEGKEPSGRAAAYICRDFQCEAPETDPEKLRQRLLEV